MFTKKQSSPKKLPPELEMEILSRLPIKSVVIFGCVSKRFRALISDPYFINLRLNRFQKRHKIFCTSFSHRAIDGVSTLDGFDVDVDVFVTRGNVNNELVGSSNGLILLRFYLSVLFLYNPSTSDFKELPIPPPMQNVTVAGTGFFYDDSENDYKVIMLRGDDIKASKSVRLDVYSLRLNSWTRMQDVSCNSDLPLPGWDPDNGGSYINSYLCNGAFHWKVSNRVVLSFDISKQVFSEMSLDRIPGEVSRFGNFEECLYALSSVNGANGRLYEIWLSKGYGTKACWSKFISIPCEDIPGEVPICHKPLCVLENGEVLLKIGPSHSMRVGSYCTKQNTFTKFADYPSFSFEVFYVESSVSLDINSTDEKFKQILRDRK